MQKMLTHAHCEIVQASPGRSSRIRHRNALTERAWKDPVQGLGNRLISEDRGRLCSQGNMESHNFLMWLFIIMWCGFFIAWCGYFIMPCGFFIMSRGYFIMPCSYFIMSRCYFIMSCNFFIMSCSYFVLSCVYFIMWFVHYVMWFVHYVMWFRLYVLLTSLPVQSSSTQALLVTRNQVKPVLRGAQFLLFLVVKDNKMVEAGNHHISISL